MIRKLCAIAAAAAVLVATPLTASAAPAAPATSVSTHYSSHYKPSHKDNYSYSKLAAKWWQWAVPEPVATNPLTDTDGRYCATGQRGKVWFLAGSTLSGKYKRSCTVPAGKDLFFPLINQVYLLSPGEDLTVAEMRAALADPTQDVKNNATNLKVWFDGKDITRKVVKFEKSKVFSATLPLENIFGGGEAYPPGFYSPVVDNGYYALIKNVRPGKHTLHFTGEYRGFELDVKYRLKVTRR